MEYWLVETGAKDQPGIDGGLMRRQQPGASTVNVVDVESVDEVSAAIEEAGGVTVVPKMAVPGIGWAAYFQDPEGNVFGVLQSDPNAGGRRTCSPYNSPIPMQADRETGLEAARRGWPPAALPVSVRCTFLRLAGRSRGAFRHSRRDDPTG